MRNTLLRSLILTTCLAASLEGSLAATPTFYARRDYPGLDSTFLQVADTNGDGIPDMIANQGGVIEVLFGNGNGTFRSGPTTDTGESGKHFAAASLGNGQTDLIFPVGNGIAVCLGTGNGAFQSGISYTVNDSGIAFLVSGDFNGDGILDIAAAANTGVWLFTGKGDGTFNAGVLAAPLALFNPEIAAADFNGDQALDLVVTSPTGRTGGSGGFAVLFGNGDGTFQGPRIFSQPTMPNAVAIGSLTKGGPAGIALSASESNYVYLYAGNGAGQFSGPTYVNLPGTGVSGLAIGDVNTDGNADLVSAGGYVAYGNGSGGFAKAVSYVINTYETSTVILSDLRGNGLTDIITDGYQAISVLLNQGKGGFEDGIWTAVTGGAGCGVAADFNGDGKPDLAINNSNGIAILLGTGKAFTPYSAGTNITLANADCLVTGDLNGDGIPDLLVPVNGTVVAYLGNGDGTFTLKSTTQTPSGGYLVLADFNHDGKLDFATSGNLVALGNGDGTFQAPSDIVDNPPSSGFSGIAAGDINNDGWPDLVLTNNAVPYNNVFALLNNHHGGFTQVPTDFGALSYEPILADLTGNGNLDLILFYASGRLDGPPIGPAVYVGNGRGEFTYKESLANPAGLDGINMVADMNGDGIPDISMLVGDTLTIFLGEGGANYATPFSIGTGPSYGDLLVSNLHGQSLSAGLPDIVEPDTSGGVMVLLNLTK
jgi:hypothetical protein